MYLSAWEVWSSSLPSARGSCTDTLPYSCSWGPASSIPPGPSLCPACLTAGSCFVFCDTCGICFVFCPEDSTKNQSELLSETLILAGVWYWDSPFILCTAAATAAKLLQSCLTLCDPIDSSPLGSAVPGILQARTLEWVAISFSNAWKWKVKLKSLSRVRLLATPWTAAYQAPPSMGFSRQEYGVGCHYLLRIFCTIFSNTTSLLESKLSAYLLVLSVLSSFSASYKNWIKMTSLFLTFQGSWSRYSHEWNFLTNLLCSNVTLWVVDLVINLIWDLVKLFFFF